MQDYYIIHGWMNRDLGLKGTTKELYAYIYGFSNNDCGGCWASEKKMAETIGVTDRSIRNAISELENRGLIKNVGISIYKTNTYVAIVPSEKNSTPEKNSDDRRKKFPNTAEKISDNNKEEKKKDNKYNTQITEIFTYWNSLDVIKHKVCTDKIKKSIVKLLTNGYSVEDIKLSISNYNTMLKDESCWFTYKWTLSDFLSRQNGFSAFLNDGERWISYMQFKKQPFKSNPKKYCDNISQSNTEEANMRNMYREEMEGLLPFERISYEEWLNEKK